jgi:hypothetical protein
MKKTIIAAVMLCGIILFNTADAQTTVGVKGGLNISNLSNWNVDNRVSGHVGVFLNSRINQNWAIQPEILYSGQGVRYSLPDGNKTQAVDYITVPIMVQYYPVRRFYVEAGPQIAFLTRANVHNRTTDHTSDVSAAYKKTDAGINVGVGINATNNLGFFARYDFGLVDVTQTNLNYKNMVGQVGITLKLNQ